MSNCSQADSTLDDPKQRDLDVQPAEKAPPWNAQGERQQTKVCIKIQLLLNKNLSTFDGRENERLLNSEPERFYRSKSDRPLSPDPERVISAELLSNSYL